MMEIQTIVVIMRFNGFGNSYLPFVFNNVTTLVILWKAS